MFFKSQRERATKRGVERLLFLFHLILTINCLILPLSNVTHAQSPCSIKLTTTVTPASCQANGEIICHLSDTSGSHLEQIRYSYFSNDRIDSIRETESAALSQFRPGLYKVKVSALCQTGLSQEEAYTIVSDSVENVEITSTYTIPTCQAMYNIYTTEQPYGIVPSFTCQPTGKAQLKISNGIFPYTVDILKIQGSDTIFIKRKVFESYQHQGTSANSFDFYHYYTIDSLDVGSYKILFHDGCDYYTPAIYLEIPEVQSGVMEQAHLLKNCSNIPTSNNIITFKELLDKNLLAEHNDDYYRTYDTTFGPLLEYRFINPTTSERLDTTRWYSLPLQKDGTLFLYDTMAQLSDYGSAWFKEVLLQFRPRYCSDDQWTFHYTIYPHISCFSNGNIQDIANANTPNYRNNCGFHWGYRDATSTTKFYHYTTALYTCQSTDSLNCRNPYYYTLQDGIPDVATGIKYHRYVTFPLKCKITSLTTDTVLKFWSDSQTNFHWSLIFATNPFANRDTIIVEITDANDCPIIAEKSYIRYDTTHRISDSSLNPHIWAEVVDIKNPCPEGMKQIGLMEKSASIHAYPNLDGNFVYTYYGDTIRLIESPKANFYNFTAYADGPKSFHVIKENSENITNIEYGEQIINNNPYPALLVTDYGLPSGRYVWTVTYYHNCDRATDTIIQEVQFPDGPTVVESPSYQFRPGCSKLEIIPAAGQYEWNGDTLETYFQVHTLGEFAHSVNSVRKNGVMSVGLPGSYIISMYALPDGRADLLAESPCFIQDTIIQWDGNTVEFNYLQSYVCNHQDTTGFVRARGKNGSLPYLYKVYSQPDLGGVLLGQNDIGDFDHLPIRANQELSLEISDACNAHFHTNFKVTDMESIRKCWVEDRLYEASFREGDTCHLYSIALNGVDFHWSGPDGFDQHTQNPVFPITGEQQTGTYHLDILNTGCGILRDSLRITVLPADACPEAVDFDGNRYPAVRIDGLCWTTENLRSVHYSDGRVIEGRMSYYSDLFPDTAANVSIYGHLYSWAAAVDTSRQGQFTPGGHVQGICPDGWYLPEEADYRQLAQHGAAALRSPLYWLNDSGGHNSTGFSALPAGFYNGSTRRFENLRGETRFWSNSNANPDNFSSIFLINHSCEEVSTSASNIGNGYSIRCIFEE